MRCHVALVALLIVTLLPAASRADEVSKSIELLQNADPLKRRTAALVLGEAGSAKAIIPLIKVLVDDDLFVRAAAARALGAIGDRRAVPALVSLLNDTEDKVRSAALLALANINDPRAISGLVSELKQGQEAAAMALGQMKARKALKPLAEVLAQGTAPMSVRRKAAWALGQLGDKKAVKPLLAALRSDDETLHKAAGEALVQLGEVAVTPLMTLTRKRKHPYRVQILGLLGEIGDQRAFPALLVAANDSDYKARAAALTAAAAIDVARIEAKLLGGLKDEEVAVRRAAAAGLARGLTPYAILGLEKAIKKDKDAQVRRLSIQALGKLGDRRGLAALVHALQKDPDADARFAAVTAMYRVRHRGMIQSLKGAALDKDQRVRESAAKLLTEMLKR